MKTFSAVIVLAAILAVPGTAVAKSKDPDKRAAIAQCKSERGRSKASHRAFKAKYHSFRRCTRQNVVVARTASKECKVERSDEDFPTTHDDKSFEEFYGTNHNRRNAFGKCVSTKVDEQEGDDEATDPADDDGDDEQCDGDHEKGNHDDGDAHEHDDGDDSGEDD